jgi:SAM-dependent methyltransferase
MQLPVPGNWSTERLTEAVRRRYRFITGTGDYAQRWRLRTYCQGNGIEIGALHYPLPVPNGAAVQYVDRLPNVELAAHYPEHPPQDLVPVTILATAEDLSPVASGSQDFVIANHLLEHCENPVRALSEFERVLRPSGIVYLAIPDQRFTFDRDRDLTSIEHLIEEFKTGPERNRFAHYMDYAVNVDHRDVAYAEQLMKRGYSIHFHVWRKETFRPFLDEAIRVAKLGFHVIDEDAGDNEFILILRKGVKARDRLWRLLPGGGRLRAAAREVLVTARSLARP